MTATAIYPVPSAAGIAETQLPDELLARLPDRVAPAPWHTTDCRVTTWMHELDPAALAAYPEVIRPKSVALVAWALVQYGDTPVGPYSELAATLVGGDSDYAHIPFIVVDSLASIVGGRANWLLPKALARFVWTDDTLGVSIVNEVPALPAWSARVTITPGPDANRLTVPNHLEQVSTDGAVRRFDGEITGMVRGATIDVDAEAHATLAVLLRSGRYDGTIITDCDFRMGPLHP
ncbi:MAG TPA: acetoacetate decarboxylase family protein [Mycobacteriales bacterium]|nr:acetoacetate decarboxylase family protein [Mycobacteriales bacterium]